MDNYSNIFKTVKNDSVLKTGETMNNTSTSVNITSLDSVCGPGVFVSYPLAHEIIQWIRVTELLFTVVLNTAVIILLVRLRKRSNLVFFVTNLAISDLSVGLFHVLPLLIDQHFSSSWTIGLGLCKLNFYINNVSLFASTYLIVIIGIDRLQSVFSPLSTVRQFKRYRYLMVLSPWIFSMMLCLPLLDWTTLIPFCGRIFCSPDLNSTGMPQTIVSLNVILLLLVPAIMIFCCYGFIVFLLCQRLNQDKRASSGETDLLRSNDQSKKISDANKRSIIITFVVGITFVICWTPYNLIMLLNTFRVIGPGAHYDIVHSLAPLNSVLNPIIFFTFNHRMFRRPVSYRYSRTVETRIT